MSDKVHRVMSVKGKKVLHIDRNDHYGGCVIQPELRLMVHRLIRFAVKPPPSISNLCVGPS